MDNKIKWVTTRNRLSLECSIRRGAKEFSKIYGKLRLFFYCFHKATTGLQLNLVHAIPSYFFKIHFVIVFSSVLLSSGLIYQVFSEWSFRPFFISHVLAMCPTVLSVWCDHSNSFIKSMNCESSHYDVRIYLQNTKSSFISGLGTCKTWYIKEIFNLNTSKD